MNDKSLGIYVNSEKKFYYLESGDNYVANTVDRIKKALVARTIIKTPTGASYAPQGYEIMSCLQAKAKEFVMVPIYISKNVEEAFANKSQTPKDSMFK